MLHFRIITITLLLTVLTTFSEPSAAVTVVSQSEYKGNPVYHGLVDLNAAILATPGLPRNVCLSVVVAGRDGKYKAVPKKDESFAIFRNRNVVTVAGRDDIGTMYGCYELAERLRIYGKKALELAKPIVQSPSVTFRAVNPFLTLPYKEDEKDWWFLKDDYWEGYLNQLSHARINWIDLHGMYDIKTTRFPNMYPYFIASEKFPLVGVEPEKARCNLTMLKKVMRMAKERGIKFALMSYSASWNVPGGRVSPYEKTDDNLAAYTREVVRKMIQSCPDLDMIGFRTGESGQSEDFFRKSYVPAIKESGRNIPLYTRTWVTTKDSILETGKQFPGRFFIEVKYNGEQFGPPYIVAGGRMLSNYSYSYQDYYSYPINYKIIYQIRMNGTHRVFPWGNPEMAARATQCSTLGGATGFCVEPLDAYYPKYDFRHRDDSPNRWYKWQYQRDWYFYNVWGRTGYDTSTAKQRDIWINMFAKHFGKAVAPHICAAMDEASRIIPDCYTAYAINRPDHRDHAPELETGGTLRDWADGQPFDIQNVQSPREYADRYCKNVTTAKASPFDMAGYISRESLGVRKLLNKACKVTKNPRPEFNDLVTELRALSYIGDYYSNKLVAATDFALMEARSDRRLEANILGRLDASQTAWGQLAEIGDAHYKPFVDKLRMWDEDFTWSKQTPKLAEDYRVLSDAVSAIQSSKLLTCNGVSASLNHEKPTIKVTSVSIKSINPQKKVFKVTVRVTGNEKIESVNLKHKPFPSERLWSLKPMTRTGDCYSVEIAVLPEGMMWSVEAVGNNGNGAMWPDFRKETPYKYVLPWNAPMPWGDAEKALRNIAGVKISSDRYSALMIGSKAWTINGMPKNVKDHVINLVNDGLNLIVLAQDSPTAWDYSWLGGDLKISDKRFDEVRFTSDNPLLSNVPKEMHKDQIAWCPVESGDSIWSFLSEPKTLAIRKVGKGQIILVQLNLRGHIWYPDVEQLYRNIISYAKNGNNKPLVLLDPGGSAASWSMLDYINQPYVRLGEVP